jgi:DNA-binding NtrC family response regulator
VRLPGDRNPLLQSKVPATVWGLWPDAKGNPEAIVVEQGTGARLEIAVLPAVDDGNEIAEILAAVLGYIGLDGATAEKLEKLKAYATACCERAAEKAENVAPQAKKAQAAAEAAVAQAEKDLAGAAVAVPGPGRATGKARDPVVRAREKAARAKARVDAVARDVDAYHWFPVGSSLSLYTSYNDLVTASMAPGRHVLITGETGVGKEATARTLHAMTFSKHRPFVAMNCAGLTEHLADSQLFGYRKGAFNEAYEDRDGLVQEADGGTLFLDEIQALPPVVRQKLLRFLQDGTFHRLGEAVERQATVRVVAATNRTGYEKDDELRTSGFLARFTFTIKLPPLRHRRDDIDELIRHFVAEVKEDYRGQAKSGTCGTTAIPPGRLANLYPDTGTIADWRSRTWRHENIRGLKSAVVKWFYGKVRDAVLAGGLDVTPRETVNLSDEGLLAVLRKIDHDGVSSFAEAREYFPAYPDSGKRRYIDGGWKAVRQRINRMEESSTEAKTGKREARHLLGKLRARIPEQPSGSSETPPRGPRRHRRQRASGLTG